MRNEEFNEFLKNRADRFEMKPSSGSFDAMLNKLDKKRKRKNIAIWSALAAACIAGILCFSIFNTATPTTNAPFATTSNSNNNLTQANENTGTQNNEALKNTESALNTGAARITAPADNNVPAPLVTKTNQSVNNTTDKNTLLVTKEKPVNVLEDDAPVTGTQLPANDIIDTATTIAGIDDIEPAPLQVAVLEDAEAAENPPVAAGKNEKSTNKKCNCTGKWFLQAYYNPFATSFYRTQNNKAEPSATVTQFNNLGQGGSIQTTTNTNIEGPQNGFETGIRIARKINQHFSLVTGLGYNRWGIKKTATQTISDVDSVESYDIDPVTNQPKIYYVATYNEAKYQQITTTITYNSVQVPIFAQYNHTMGKWGIMAQAGVYLGYTFGNSQTTNTYTRTDTAKRIQPSINSSSNNADVIEAGYRAFNVGFSSTLAVTYKLSKCVDIYAGPRLSASMLSYNLKNSNTDKLKYPAFWGIETGIKINL